MTTILKVHEVTGGYDPGNPTIRNISFNVRKKEIVALIGLNGSGKSTTIKHILGLMKPLNGYVSIFDQLIETNPEEFRSKYAYIPETPIYYEELTLWEHLELTAMTYGLTKETFMQRVPILLKTFNMEKKEKLFPQHFSKGMRQKMMIMIALMLQPPLYIIDEPLMGLDPLGIRSLLLSLQQEKERGAGILMSTHILSTAEKYCDRFIIIHEGKILIQGTLEELQNKADQPKATLDELYVQFIEGMVKQ